VAWQPRGSVHATIRTQCLSAKSEQSQMKWTKVSGLVTATMAAALIAVPATAQGDAVPTTDEVVAVLAKLTDPNIPAANKTDIVTPGFAPDEAGTIDDHLNRMNAPQFALLPPNFVVTDIQPAPNNMAGATVATTGGFRRDTNPRPIVLVNQGGHWLITDDTAMTELDALWNAARSGPHWVPFVPRARSVLLRVECAQRVLTTAESRRLSTEKSPLAAVML
jgi:hypothetical protein